jgi:hypothetical protein
MLTQVLRYGAQVLRYMAQYTVWVRAKAALK